MEAGREKASPRERKRSGRKIQDAPLPSQITGSNEELVKWRRLYKTLLQMRSDILSV
jgi:hypothetical protein